MIGKSDSSKDPPLPGDKLLDAEIWPAKLESLIDSKPKNRLCTSILHWIIRFFIAYTIIYLLIGVVILLRPMPSNRLSYSLDQPKCETIHLASICGGYSSTQNFYVLLKSILFHRRGYKIHYHIFVDNISRKILNKLFETWPIQDFEISYYNVTYYERDILWIPNVHYSNRYGLMKLLVPTILAENGVSNIILLDTDMLALGDIAVLWKQFSTMSAAFLGLVENQSDWYLSRKNAWPAKGRGFNTGLMLIDVKKASENNWATTWREVAELELISLRSTSLADQDIYNAAIKKHSHIVSELPCHFNIQLNNNSDLNHVCPKFQDQNVNIVHWNTPRKFETSNRYLEYFESFQLTFKNWNGKLLERVGCLSSETIPERDNTKWQPVDYVCRSFHPSLNDHLRTFLYYGGFELDYQPDDKTSNYDVTAVVHLSIDRFKALQDFAAHWSGPISVAIYLSEADTSFLTDLIDDDSGLNERKNIAYHLVYSVPGWHYPINRMRNIALENVVTPYVFIIDADFLPSKDLYLYLRNTITALAEFKIHPLDKIALVVPAFQDLRYKTYYPLTKVELVKQMQQGNIVTFRSEIWPQGQNPTDYDTWKRSTKAYKVKWEQDYEPFIVTSKNVIKFDERFIGFGWNKVEHDMSLAAHGYNFFVLPDAFIVHQAHTASRDVTYFRQDREFHRCITHLKEDVESDLMFRFRSFNPRA